MGVEDYGKDDREYWSVKYAEGCGAVDSEDLDACGHCADCTDDYDDAQEANKEAYDYGRH